MEIATIVLLLNQHRFEKETQIQDITYNQIAPNVSSIRHIWGDLVKMKRNMML